MQEHEASRRIKYEKHGLTLRPQIYRITNTKDTTYYVKFDNICWQFSNVMKVIDITFKTYQALNLTYQYENINPWTFIQQFVYKITTKYDIKTPCLSTLLKTLGQHE